MFEGLISQGKERKTEGGSFVNGRKKAGLCLWMLRREIV